MATKSVLWNYKNKTLRYIVLVCFRQKRLSPSKYLLLIMDRKSTF